jgi:hypothetical protein
MYATTYADTEKIDIEEFYKEMEEIMKKNREKSISRYLRGI